MTVRVSLAALFPTALLAAAAPAVWGDWVASGGITATHQVSSDDRIDDEFTASADLIFTRATQHGEWRIYIEASSSPETGAVSAVHPEANADAGSALDEDRDGRVQISELNYRHAFDEGRSITAGLIDVSGYFDQSRIASDENTQFLGVSFVQNPSIEFPDYTLGVIYEHALAAGPTLRAGIASSNGLADNPNLSYSQLVDIDDADKGVFAIASATWKKPAWLLRAGAWTHTADHDTLDGAHRGRRNYGAYFLAGYQAGAHGVNLRGGVANEDVSRAARFAALSYRLLHGPFALGAGAARIFLSNREPDAALDDTTHYEAFLRYALARGIYITGDVQYLVNSNFDQSGAVHDRAVTVYGVRFTYLFE